MNFTTKNLEKGKIELTITVEKDEYEKFLKGAAVRISDSVEIKGFRKGHVPYDVVLQNVGEMAVYEESLKRLIPSFYAKAVEESKLETIGQPEIDVTKLVPGNPITFVVRAFLVPEVKLPDFTKIKVEKKEPKVEKEKIDEVLKNIQGMRAEEKSVERAATKSDKVIIDMNMFSPSDAGGAQVPIEGGQTKDHGVYLNENYYIPGLPEQLVGIKKDETKKFALTMPETHYQKHLAGKQVNFEVTAKDVQERILPELTDEFAKTLGQDSMDKLKGLITSNMLEEARHKESQRFEIALLEAAIEKTVFGEIPQNVVDGEKDRMLHELEYGIKKQGADLETYLGAIKKTKDDLMKEWTVEATKRAQAALFSRQFAKDKNIKVEEADLLEEKTRILESYKNSGKEDLGDIEERLNDPGVLNSIATTIQNRKVLDELKKLVSA